MGRNNGCSMGEICCLINFCFIYVNLLYYNRRESDEQSSSHSNSIESDPEGSSSSSIRYDNTLSDYVMYGITTIYLISMFGFLILLCSIMKNKTHKHNELPTNESQSDEGISNSTEVTVLVM